jgi:hypothetical protein
MCGISAVANLRPFGRSETWYFGIFMNAICRLESPIAPFTSPFKMAAQAMISPSPWHSWRAWRLNLDPQKHGHDRSPKAVERRRVV